jgi:hypothetical protein
MLRGTTYRHSRGSQQALDGYSWGYSLGTQAVSCVYSNYYGVYTRARAPACSRPLSRERETNISARAQALAHTHTPTRAHAGTAFISDSICVALSASYRMNLPMLLCRHASHARPSARLCASVCACMCMALGVCASVCEVNACVCVRAPVCKRMRARSCACVRARVPL